MPSNHLDDLLAQMTIAEKVALLGGADMWHTAAIPRLGIPAIKVSDGPNGVRGAGSFSNGTQTTCFPAGIALAATWNVDLVQQVGQALGQEARDKGVQVLLAPTVNMFRTPLNGRNFEAYSEDPYLASRLAVAYIRGVQSQGIGTSIKHYIGNESEYQRFTMSSDIGERALREIYLPPFRAAIREAQPWTIMAAYNAVNGVFASEHAELLTQILRTEWGYEGVVISDWFMSVKSTAPSINAGLDLEMPGPPLWRGAKLQQAVDDGEVSLATLDRSVRRILHLVEKTGKFAQLVEDPEQAIDRPEHDHLARRAAAEGCVLLKNAPVAGIPILPLATDHLRSIAIIGPNAKVARIMAGGSASVTPHHAVTPFDGIAARVRDSVKLGFEPGCQNHKMLPLFTANQVRAGTTGTTPGLEIAYFNGAQTSATPVTTAILATSSVMWLGNLPAGITPTDFSVRVTARFTPDVSGPHQLSLGCSGPSFLALDGHPIITQALRSASFGELDLGQLYAEEPATVMLTANQTYTLVMEGQPANVMGPTHFRIGCLTPFPEDAIARATQLAAQADVALVFAGLSGEWESEGFDRPDLRLVGDQDHLIAAVAAANPRTVVVLNTGAPIAMPWLGDVAAVLQAWYPGQECGHAIADVLFGIVNPSGKLPQTFPARLEDTPAFLNYPGENHHVAYGEGIFIGYRAYEKKQVAPLFPFGFGLSYTTFTYGPPELSTDTIGPDETITVSVPVTNTGKYAGQEVVQIYVCDPQATLIRPEKELKAFTKLHLEPGASTTAVFTLDRESLAFYDAATHQWVAEAGEFEVLVGASSQDIRGRATFTLIETARFQG